MSLENNIKKKHIYLSNYTNKFQSLFTFEYILSAFIFLVNYPFAQSP